MKRGILALVGLVLGAVPAAADWVKVGPGPTLPYAQAYCENAAMGLLPPGNRGFVVSGNYVYSTSPGLLGAIGSAVKKARFTKNCMYMQGWQEVKSKSTKAKPKKNLSGSSKN